MSLQKTKNKLEFPKTPAEKTLQKAIDKTPADLKEKEMEKTLMALPNPTFFPNPAKKKLIMNLKKVLMNGIAYNPRSKLSKQEQDEQLFLKLCVCDSIQLPYTFFKDVYLIQGGYELQVGAMNWLVAHNAPEVEVVLEWCDETMVIYRMRQSKKHKWFPFKYTAEMASKLVQGYNSNKHWKYDKSTMLRSRCLGKGYRTVCPLALKGAQYVLGEISNELPEFKDSE